MLKAQTFLLDKGADIEGVGVRYMKPLHYAALQDTVVVTKVLVARGANLNARNDYAQTPLHIAMYAATIDAVALLTDSGADIRRAKPKRRYAVAFGCGK